MTIEELVVSSEEQLLSLDNGYTADLRFDPFYKRWFFDLYENETLIYAGVALNEDTVPLLRISKKSLGCLDKLDDKNFFEPYSELGSRLALVEVNE